MAAPQENMCHDLLKQNLIGKLSGFHIFETVTNKGWYKKCVKLVKTTGWMFE